MSAPEGLGSVIDDAIHSVKELSATALTGYGVSTAAYGISIVQVYLYFRNYPKDSIFLKLTVAALWTLDTLSSIVNSHALYTLCVLNFNNLFADAHIPWSWPTTINTTSLIFYGWQIWGVSKNFMVLLLALVSCAAGSFKYPALPSVAGLYISVYLFLFPTIVSLVGHTFRSMTTTIESTGLVCDITITISLIYYLRSRKAAGVQTTQHMIDSLIMHAMSRGILTAVCITMLFILDVAYPNHFYWVPFYELVGKLYVNSILASLNARTSVRGKGRLEVSTRSTLWAMEFASGSGSTPRCDSKTANSDAGSGKGFQAQLGMMDHSESNRDVGIKSFPQDAQRRPRPHPRVGPWRPAAGSKCRGIISYTSVPLTVRKASANARRVPAATLNLKPRALACSRFGTGTRGLDHVEHARHSLLPPSESGSRSGGTRHYFRLALPLRRPARDPARGSKCGRAPQGSWDGPRGGGLTCRLQPRIRHRERACQEAEAPGLYNAQCLAEHARHPLHPQAEGGEIHSAFTRRRDSIGGDTTTNAPCHHGGRRGRAGTHQRGRNAAALHGMDHRERSLTRGPGPRVGRNLESVAASARTEQTSEFPVCLMRRGALIKSKSAPSRQAKVHSTEGLDASSDSPSRCVGWRAHTLAGMRPGCSREIRHCERRVPAPRHGFATGTRCQIHSGVHGVPAPTAPVMRKSTRRRDSTPLPPRPPAASGGVRVCGAKRGWRVLRRDWGGRVAALAPQVSRSPEALAPRMQSKSAWGHHALHPPPQKRAAREPRGPVIPDAPAAHSGVANRREAGGLRLGE
ncbi:hypothetical protein DFH07DRAFT_1003360 [Mycena maculata]|uniref:DUF6534 domain-containing protein n=1 Tax=Mycena maculata TaxID=230809 RepID=A0AAD7HPF6_9AGAR|nr:hypothetical protein DFH07DRAFT_1003360 [Mycena maculata]